MRHPEDDGHTGRHQRPSMVGQECPTYGYFRVGALLATM